MARAPSTWERRLTRRRVARGARRLRPKARAPHARASARSEALKAGSRALLMVSHRGMVPHEEDAGTAKGSTARVRGQPDLRARSGAARRWAVGLAVLVVGLLLCGTRPALADAVCKPAAPSPQSKCNNDAQCCAPGLSARRAAGTRGASRAAALAACSTRAAPSPLPTSTVWARPHFFKDRSSSCFGSPPCRPHPKAEESGCRGAG